MMTFTATKRLELAKTIFTAEEYRMLLKYELLSMFELAKQHLEWMLYVGVVLVWLGVMASMTALLKVISSASSASDTVVQYVENPINREKEAAERVATEIKKSSQSQISPEKIFDKVTIASNRFGVDRFFILALIDKECNFNETVVAIDNSITGSVGWSQATDKTWDWFNVKYVWPNHKTTYSYDDKKDPEKSLEFIGWYLSYLKKHYPDIKTNHDLYVAYNAGPNNMSSAAANRNADKCMEMYKKYKLAYETE